MKDFFTMRDMQGYLGMYPHKLLRIIRELEIERPKRRINGQLCYVFTKEQHNQILEHAGFVWDGSAWIIPARGKK